MRRPCVFGSMPNSRAACRWLMPSTWQARRTRAYRSTTFIPNAFRQLCQRKVTRRSVFAPPRLAYPAASMREFRAAVLRQGDERGSAERRLAPTVQLPDQSRQTLQGLGRKHALDHHRGRPQRDDVPAARRILTERAAPQGAASPCHVQMCTTAHLGEQDALSRLVPLGPVTS